MMRSVAQLDKEYRLLAASLAKIGYITQGSVFERKRGAGSRYQWTWKNKRQKTESLTLTYEQYQWLQKALSNECELKQVLKKMRRVSEQIFLRSVKSPS